MKEKVKITLAWLLALALCLGSLPKSALAATVEALPETLEEATEEDGTSKETAISLKLDTVSKITVDTENPGVAYFCYTATETGYYAFRTYDYDTWIIKLEDASGSEIVRQTRYGNGSGEAMVVPLNEGEKYFFTVETMNPNVLSVKLEKLVTMRLDDSISVNYDGIHSEFVAVKVNETGTYTIAANGTSEVYIYYELCDDTEYMIAESIRDDDGEPRAVCDLTAGEWYFMNIYGDAASAFTLTLSAGGETNDPATSGKCGEDLEWSLDDKRNLTISGTGTMTDYSEPWLDNPAPWGTDIQSVQIDEGVTSIGANAFIYCEYLNRVIIPNGVSDIGNSAFFECKNLSSVTIPDSVTSIGDSAFYGCSGLTGVTIPDSVTNIGSGAFECCSSLKSVTILDGVTNIGNFAFSECSSLTSVNIPASVSSVGLGAFWCCSRLTSIYFGGDCPSFDSDVFVGVTCTAYYPEGNETWAEVEAYPENYQFDGTITWAPWNLEDDTPSEPIEHPFTDVSESAYYYQPVLWAYENNIASGTSATTFGASAPCTRAQVAVFLWRAMGQPEPESTSNPFADVSSSAYYYKAVLWAYENGVTSGVDATHFAPNGTVTRAQFVTFLWRAMGEPTHTVSNPFTDVYSGQYYTDAILWAYEQGITSGADASHFKPSDSCTRGQVVTFLYRNFGA